MKKSPKVDKVNAEKTVSLSSFVENPDNPTTATDEDIERLAGKLKRVPLGLTAIRIAYVTDNPAGKCVVLSGNKRLRVLKRIYGEDGKVPAVWFADITAMSEAERHEFIVTANVSDGQWDVDKLLSQYDKGELQGFIQKEDFDRLLEEVSQKGEIDSISDFGIGVDEYDKNKYQFQITLLFDKKSKPVIKGYLENNTKEDLSNLVLEAIENGD